MDATTGGMLGATILSMGGVIGALIRRRRPEPGIINGKTLSVKDSLNLLLIRSEQHGERLTSIEESHRELVRQLQADGHIRPSDRPRLRPS